MPDSSIKESHEAILEVEGLFLSFTQYGAGLRQSTSEGAASNSHRARAVASGATIGSVIGASLTATEAIIETKTIYAPLPRATAPLRQN
jgi:hypothetical protein